MVNYYKVFHLGQKYVKVSEGKKFFDYLLGNILNCLVMGATELRYL